MRHLRTAFEYEMLTVHIFGGVFPSDGPGESLGHFSFPNHPDAMAATGIGEALGKEETLLTTTSS